jgi:hypothetical protein
LLFRLAKLCNNNVRSRQAREKLSIKSTYFHTKF